MATLPESHIRVRSNPRISANELARYMVTPDPGRLGIIRRSRDSTTAPRIRYAEVRTGIIAFLTDMRRPQAILDRHLQAFEQRQSNPMESEFSRQDAALSLGALNTFANMQNLLGGYRFVALPQKPGPLAIGGVNVSVNLDMLATRDKQGQKQLGGVLLRLTKPDDEETEGAAGKRREMGIYAATLAQMQARTLPGDHGQPHHELCMSIDVQCGEVHLASRNFKTRAQRLEAAGDRTRQKKQQSNAAKLYQRLTAAASR